MKKFLKEIKPKEHYFFIHKCNNGSVVTSVNPNIYYAKRINKVERLKFEKILYKD